MANPMLLDPYVPQAAPQKRTLAIYTQSGCTFCQRAKAMLDTHGIAYVEHPVDGDEVLRLDIVERTGGRKVLPQVFINDNHLGGFFELKRHCLEGSLPLLLAMG